MKLRSLVPVFAILAILASMISCSDDKPTNSDEKKEDALVGSWLTISIFADGVPVTVGNDPYNLLVNHGIWNFNANGTVSVTYTYGGGTDTFVWSVEGNDLVLGDGYHIPYTLNGNVLTTFEEGNVEDGQPAVQTIYNKQ